MNTTIRGGALRQLYDSKTGNNPVPGFAGGGLIDKIKSVVGISTAPKPAPAPEPQNAPAPVLNIRKYAENNALDKRMNAAGLKDGGVIKGPGGALRKMAESNSQKSEHGGKLKGPGTATSDSIPATVVDTGEPIKVANGERIVSKKQDAFLLVQAQADGFDTVDEWLEDGTGHPVGPTLSYNSTKKMADGGVLDASQLPQDTYSPQAPAPAAAPAFSDTQIQAHKDAAKGIPDTFQKLAVPSLGVISGFKAGGAIRKMAAGGLVDDAVDKVNRLNAETIAANKPTPTIRQIAAASAPAPASPTPQAQLDQSSVVSQIPTGGVPGAGPTPPLGAIQKPALPASAPATVPSAPVSTAATPNAGIPVIGQPSGAIRKLPTTADPALSTVAGGAVPAAGNQVTRIGNSYSGAPGITGDISLVDGNGAPIRSGGAIRPQNNQAAENLARRYGQTEGFGTATSGGGTVSTVPGMSQDKINATLTNPDGSRWTAQDQAIMAANVRDGVDPYRGTSRATKQISMREHLAGLGEATARRGQDINANTAKMNLDAQMASQKATNDIAQKRLGLDEQRASLDDAQKARVAKLDDLILNGNPLQQKMAASQKAAIMGKGLEDGKALNEGQAKSLSYGSRMMSANKTLDQLAKLEKEYSTPGANGIAGSAVNWLNTKEGQMLDQAKRDFLNATLRRESGAVINPSEFESGNQQYFPQVGDSDEVKAQKRENRLVAQRGILADVPDAENRVAKILKPETVDAAGYDALPKGATYTTPSGEVRRKK